MTPKRSQKSNLPAGGKPNSAPRSKRDVEPLNLLSAVAARIRKLRLGKGLTLKSLAEASSISPSMLSQIERGGALPSIGSLFAIANALSIPVSQLIVDEVEQDRGLVIRRADQRLVKTSNGATRILRDDRHRGVSISINDYKPRSGGQSKAVTHNGFEYGVVLEGVLTIEIAQETHELEEGDVIAFSSERSHKIYNHGDVVVRTLWINVQKE